jgi:hypothetical protein
MIAMPIRKAARSAVSIIAIGALLLCQAAWAGMRAPERLMAAIGQVSNAPAAASCHDLGGSDTPQHAAPSPCESAQLPSDDSKMPVLAPMVLDVLYALHLAPLHESPPADIQLARPAGLPPPLRLLHCRFRN